MDNLKSITIVVPEGDLVVSSISGTYKLFKAAIEESQQNVNIFIAAKNGSRKLLDGFVSINPNKRFNQITTTDLIVIPAIKNNLDLALDQNDELLSWLKIQYQNGAHIASLCTGTFLLGKSGLIEGKKCTTHWMFSKKFKELFPNALFRESGIITEDDRIFTSGGAYSFLNLIVYLTQRFFGREISQSLVNVYQIDNYRKTQDEFTIFSSQKDHSVESIKKAQLFIEQNFNKKISNDQIANAAKLGKRTMVRKFKKSSGNTPNEYLQRVRIEKAKELLAGSDKQIAEIQYSIGYNDSKTFRSIFQKTTGKNPSEYRRKYQIK